MFTQHTARGAAPRPSPQTRNTPVPSPCPHQSDPTCCWSLAGDAHLISRVGCHTSFHRAAVLPNPLWEVSPSQDSPPLPKPGDMLVQRQTHHNHGHPQPLRLGRTGLPDPRDVPPLARGGPALPALRACSVEASCRDFGESPALQQLILQVPGCNTTVHRQLHPHAEAPVILGL